LKVDDNEFCKGGEKAFVCIASIDKLWLQLLPQLNGFEQPSYFVEEQDLQRLYKSQAPKLITISMLLKSVMQNVALCPFNNGYATLSYLTTMKVPQHLCNTEIILIIVIHNKTQYRGYMIFY